MPRATSMLAVLAVLLAAGPAAAGPLEETLALVYLDNPRLVAGRAALRAADESVALAQAGGRASVMLRSSAGVEAQDTSRGSGVVTPMRQSLGLTQPVYSGGETTAATARAESLVLAERARLGDLEQRVLMETIGVFTAVAREQAVVGRARDNEKRLTAQLDATRERLRLGDVSKTDVAQAEARQAGGVADRVQAEGELDAAVAEYIHVVGDAPGRLELPEPPDAPPETDDDTDVERSFVYQEAQYELAAAEAEIAAARSVSRPRLALMGDVSYVDEPNSYTDRQGTASLGATLQVPLYQGGSATARLRQSRDLREQRQHTLDEARRAATAAITTATHDQRTAICPHRFAAEAGGRRGLRARRRAPGSAGRLAHRARRARCRGRAVPGRGGAPAGAGAAGAGGLPPARRHGPAHRRGADPGRDTLRHEGSLSRSS